MTQKGDRSHKPDQAKPIDFLARVILTRWRNLKLMTSPQDREAELRALQAVHLFCSHNSARYRVVHVHATGNVSLSRDYEQGRSIDMEVPAGHCSDWSVKAIA